MTAEYVAFHAAERPDAVALIYRDRKITFGEFHRDIAAVTSAAREFGVARGRAVAIGCDDYYVHWLLLLAFERLGVATASLGAKETASPLLAHVDLVLSESELPRASVPRQHRITPELIKSMLARPRGQATVDSPRDPRDLVRIESTSGTTGDIKCLANSREVFEHAIENWIWRCGLSQECRYLMILPFMVAGAYHHATACLRAGGTIVIEERFDRFYAAVSRHGITQVTFLPIHLKAVLDRLPADFPKPPSLTISTLGAAVAPPLRAKALERLAIRLLETYGCNEVGFVCSSGVPHEERSNILFPRVQVEIVDDAELPVSTGQTGRIRVKTRCMVDGYLGDPAATDRRFKGGWFYPGDLGIILEAGGLIVLGREDELLNIGGRKVRPEDIETSITAHASVADTGVCTLPNPQGIEQLFIAIAGATVDEAALLRQLNHAVRHLQVGNFVVFKLECIPRTTTGKIQRNLLKEELAARWRDAHG